VGLVTLNAALQAGGCLGKGAVVERLHLLRLGIMPFLLLGKLCLQGVIQLCDGFFMALLLCGQLRLMMGDCSVQLILKGGPLGIMVCLLLGELCPECLVQGFDGLRMVLFLEGEPFVPLEFGSLVLRPQFRDQGFLMLLLLGEVRLEGLILFGHGEIMALLLFGKLILEERRDTTQLGLERRPLGIVMALLLDALLLELGPLPLVTLFSVPGHGIEMVRGAFDALHIGMKIGA
jgi:hypothetical protein